MALQTKWLLSKSQSMSCTMTGVWRAVAYCRGCAVIFHSPMGCVHVAASMDLGNHYRLAADGSCKEEEPVPLISSNLREKDGIFGGIDRLHQCISYTVETYHPECIFIASSCTAGVIGDDVDEEAEKAEETYGIPVMSMPFAGFLGGEYSDGYYKTMNAIMDRFFIPHAHDPQSVVLLGDQMGPHGQYAREVKRLLSMLGLRVDYQFPGYVPFKDWKKITGASLSVMLGTAGQLSGMAEAAARLEREFGVKSLGEIYPVGFDNTCTWLEKAAKAAGREELGEKVIREEKLHISDDVASYRFVTSGKKVCLVIGRGVRWYHLRETLSSIGPLDMTVKGIIFLPNLTEEDKTQFRKEISSFGSIPIYEGNEGEEMLHTADILLTTNEVHAPGIRQLFIPMVALAGIEGERIFLRAIYRLLCQHGSKGGITYVKA